jgi:hypothetical protein
MYQFIVDIVSWVFSDPVTVKAFVQVKTSTTGASGHSVGIIISWGK